MKNNTVLFRKGSYILLKNSKMSDNLYIIKSGRAKKTMIEPYMDKENNCFVHQKSTILNSGDFVEIISFMSGKYTVSSVVALEDTEVIVIKNNELSQFIENNPEIIRSVISKLSKKLNEYNSYIINYYSIEENYDNLYQIGKHYSDEENQPIYRIFNDKDIIFSEYEINNDLYIIIEGKVHISKFDGQNEVLLAVLEKNELFGELAILDNMPRTATATACGETKLLIFSKYKIEMILNHPKFNVFTIKLLTLICKRIWKTRIQAINKILDTAIAKIYNILATELKESKVNNNSYTYHFGISELLKLADIDILDTSINDMFKNREFFSMSALLRNVNIKNKNLVYDNFNDDKIFYLNNSVLVCNNVTKLKYVKKRLLKGKYKD